MRGVALPAGCGLLPGRQQHLQEGTFQQREEARPRAGRTPLSADRLPPAQQLQLPSETAAPFLQPTSPVSQGRWSLPCREGPTRLTQGLTEPLSAPHGTCAGWNYVVHPRSLSGTPRAAPTPALSLPVQPRTPPCPPGRAGHPGISGASGPRGGPGRVPLPPPLLPRPPFLLPIPLRLLFPDAEGRRLGHQVTRKTVGHSAAPCLPWAGTF